MQFLLKYLSLILVFITVLHFSVFAGEKEYFDVAAGQTHTYFVDDTEGSSYYWTVFTDPEFVVPAPETIVFFPGGNTGHSVEIEWRKEGFFYLAVAEYDLTGCMNIKVKVVHVNRGGFAVSAGNDTVIGQCQPFELKADVEEQEGLTYAYQWEPAEYLDNPESATPLFKPGSSTRFTVTVTNSLDVTASGAVQITVSKVKADAGPDVFIYSGETKELDASDSRGEGLEYAWTTLDGILLSGAEAVNPVVQGAGLFILKVTDRFGCKDYDTVTVGLLSREPVVFEDKVTTEYQTPLKIYILENDHDPDSMFDPASLRISVPPMHGTVNVYYLDNSIVYTPKRNFSGTDSFSYSICDLKGKCYEASVSVQVNDIRFIIPEAFSPNNDGINDYFEMPGIEHFEGNSLEIFNRWGSRVYRAQNYGISTFPLFWDGRPNTGNWPRNNHLPAGTYFYVLDLGKGEKRIAGSVYLNR